MVGWRDMGERRPIAFEVMIVGVIRRPYLCEDRSLTDDGITR
jgi:hypothetical protein